MLALLRNLPSDAWSRERQERDAVAVARAGHDVWGILSIPFVFSDDYLRRVFESPLYHDPSWTTVLVRVHFFIDIHALPTLSCSRIFWAT